MTNLYNHISHSRGETEGFKILCMMEVMAPMSILRLYPVLCPCRINSVVILGLGRCEEELEDPLFHSWPCVSLGL